MLRGVPRGCIALMQVLPAPSRVALFVMPRLLRDTLARALTANGIEIVADTGRCVDVAVVSEEGSALAVPARVVVRLPGETDAGVGTVTSAGRSALVVLDSLAAVVAVVRGSC